MRRLLPVVSALMLVLVLSGCEYTRSEAAADANAFCAERGGIERFYFSTKWEEAEVTCRDGAFDVFDGEAAGDE